MLGLDVGGANLKVAHESGAEIIYFPIWKKYLELERTLSSIAKKYNSKIAGVVITAELSDVFKNKDEGINFVSSVCKRVFEKVYFLDIYGNLKDEILDPRKFAASNWVASVKFLMMEGFSNFLFVDVGSTTSDLIPVTKKIEASLTDFERLKRDELIYFGILRTPVFHILKRFSGARLAAEFFATTADVFLVTGDIKEEDYTCETADGKGKDKISCMRRLARVLCCDLEEIGEKNVETFAFEVKKAMIDELSKAIMEKFESYDLEKVIGCGIGEFLIEEACRSAGVEYLAASSIYKEYSKLFPAFAMLKLVESSLKTS
ncbi:MAG: H4MPT-linked C1 transfer pathway protein [Archaeoglobaceae archaeon]|nr:H4MPT-linked C1 transfer pathway protein [Archaeoglobaceae archaeon]MCX8151690.1 H4MPT-linked C1 transfer pathway protein [Archaeoglobaceae archaeon]MDW8013032.1 hydantoinase/oxoprolinase family protein [Archaeoglobaceae archaeon]